MNGRERMRRSLLLVAAVLMVFSACSGKAESVVAGKWRIAERGVDQANNPCPFVPDEIEFLKDGTVALSNAPAGMKMYYRYGLTDDEAKQALAKFPYLREKGHILLMGPSNTDMINSSMAYDVSVDQNGMLMALPGWSPSRYTKVP